VVYSTLLDRKIMQSLLTVSVDDANKLLEGVNKLFAKQATDRKEDDTNFEDFRKNYYKYLKQLMDFIITRLVF
jgi:hypothetical protein